MTRVLVTGAGRGLGLEFVRQCLDRGDRVFATVRDPEGAAELRALESDGAAGERLTVIALDVADPASIAAARPAVGDIKGLDPSLERARWPWLEVRVRLDEPAPDLRARIDRALRARPVRLLKISVERGGEGGALADFPTRRELERIDPQQVFLDCYERSFGDKPDGELLAAFHELREAVAGGDALSAQLPPPGASRGEASRAAEDSP